jgi:hypothetical protein
MKKILILIGGLVVFFFAAYGAIRAVSDLFGGKPAEMTQSFTAGVATKTGEKIAEGIKQTPDKKLEEDSELMARKFYYLSKGALKGQIDAILNDPGRAEVPQKMYEAGKDLSERVVKPFARGLSEGSGGILDGSDDKVEKLKELTREGKELLDALSHQLGEIGRAIKQNAPPLPPLPGMPSPPRTLPQPPFAPPPDASPRQDVPSR